MAAPTIRFWRNFLPVISLKHSCCRLYSHGTSSSIVSKARHDYVGNNSCRSKDRGHCILRSQVAPIRHHSYHNVKTFRGFRGQLTLDSSKKSRAFIAELLPNERKILLLELQNFQDRLELKGKTPPDPPTKMELRQVLVNNAIPFVGFGFLDNAIMICAGDYLDLTIGVTLCISTMAAAALGNLISDMAGIGLAGYVETLANRFGVPAPSLTPEQLSMARTRWAAGSGRGLGIFIGCLLGMFPLLFLKTRTEETDEEAVSSSTPS